MEVHKYTDIRGVTLADAVTEGRMVLETEYGFREPRSSAEAALARYVVAWPVDNRQPPIFQTYPSYTQALRYGFDQATNLPHTTTLYYTWPGLVSEAQSIPSGSDALAYAKGEFTVGSGEWVYSASVVAGSELEVATDGTGKLQLKSSGTAVAMCTAKDTFLKTLRFRTYGNG
jgi:hypothetical protein